MTDDAQKLGAPPRGASLLAPEGRFVFDVFAPSAEDIEETDGRWLGEPGIFERADWDEPSRTLRLSVRSGDASASFTLHWLEAPEWRALLSDAGLEVEALYGWFDHRPFDGGEDMIWICRRVSRQSGSTATSTERVESAPWSG